MHARTQEKISLAISTAIMTMLQIVLAFATAVAVSLHSTMAGAAQLVSGTMLGDGPSPAAQTSANMPQAGLTVHYNAVFMKFLYAVLNKYMMCTHMTMPEKSGQTFRNFMNAPLGPDITQQTEGTIDSPEQITTNLRDIVLGQWANYTNISDFAFLTSISDDLVNFRRVMAYQFGLTIDDLIMALFNSLITLDSRTTNQDATVYPYAFTKNIIEQMPGSLGGATVPPMEDGYYNGSIHDFFVSDLGLDNSNNSIVDVWKHTESGQRKLTELPGGTDGETPAQILSLFGAHWRKSTNQTQTANWQGSGLTAISTYLAGMDAMVFINFPNDRHTKVVGNWQNLDLWAGKYERSSYDPNGVIAAGTGYNGILGIGPPPDNTSRMRIARAVPQTS